MSTYYAQKMQQIFDQYRQEVSSAPVDLKEVGAWAIGKGLWQPRPADIAASFAREMAEALREEVKIDKDGRRHRAKIPARTITKDGAPLFVWADIDDAPRAHVEKNIAQTRRQIVGDSFQLRLIVDHYNSTHPDKSPLQLVLDFTDDVEEQLIAKGLKGDDDGDGEAATG